MPRVFGGIGLEALANDAPETPAPGDPQRTFFELERVPVSTAMRIEGGAAIAARLGAGIEFVSPPTLDFAARGSVVRSTTHRGEKLLLGIVRAGSLPHSLLPSMFSVG